MEQAVLDRAGKLGKGKALMHRHAMQACQRTSAVSLVTLGTWRTWWTCAVPLVTLGASQPDGTRSTCRWQVFSRVQMSLKETQKA